LLGDNTTMLRDILASCNKDQEMLPEALKKRVKLAKEHNLKS
jgi:hypothetical protein